MITALIVNYRTPDLTRACLQLFRQKTDLTRVRTIVIDNDSRDASLDHLRGLSSIELVERRPEPGETAAMAHARALDEGLKGTETPFFLSLHTDTLIRQRGWLDVLMQPMSDSRVAGVGCWKLEVRSPAGKLGKWLESMWQRSGRKRMRRRHRFLRTCCALYRTWSISTTPP